MIRDEEQKNIYIQRRIDENHSHINEYGVPKLGARIYVPPGVINGRNSGGLYTFPGSVLEYFSAELVGTICHLWRELSDPDVPANPKDMATWVSGIITGIGCYTDDYEDRSLVMQRDALADLETLESVLVMRGRGAA